jgi:hypothetical protein
MRLFMNWMNKITKGLIKPLYFVVISFSVLSLTGCIPAIIGAVAYSGAQSDATKQKFLDDFNRTNIEREKSGLKPLEYCVELRRFDSKVADQDDECKQKTGSAVESLPSQAVTQRPEPVAPIATVPPVTIPTK